MTRITENTIESFSIELFEKLGYEYIYAPKKVPLVGFLIILFLFFTQISLYFKIN